MLSNRLCSVVLKRSFSTNKCLLQEIQPKDGNQKLKEIGPYIAAGLVGVSAGVFLIANDGFEGLYDKYISSEKPKKD
ncbi:ndhB [Acrasis kona]|uniref:NdhB n=1 Tax=Acrasis kona TaxID=1008807 RepID=A0AAW2ZBA2_9EUKA